MNYSHNNHRIFVLMCISLFLPGISACSSIVYYTHSVKGQLEIIQKSVPIQQILDNNSLPEQVSIQLAEVRGIRDFAIVELGLPDNDSYRLYADLGRDYVVWNVFATPELLLKSREWCYFIAGCLSYRGYFSKEGALKLAAELESQGYDVFVGGVTAYSTLGWFADPVLNTMLHWDITYLAKVIFHELSHQKIYIKNDTEFNEAFAETVALIGVERWLEKHGTIKSRKEFIQKQSREDSFVDLVLLYRQQLDELYQSSLTEEDKRTKKNIILQDMVNEYQKIRSDWVTESIYDTWFALGINNAKLMAVSTYRKLVPGFRKLLRTVDDDLASFYKLVENLGQCSHEQRREILLSGSNQFSC